MLARLHAVLTTPPRADRIRRYLRSGKSDLAFAAARLSNFGPHAPPSLVEHIAAISGQAPIEVWTDGLSSILSLDLRHATLHVKVPSLVVVGDLDRLTPPASARALTETLPDARLVVLKGAGHIAMMERHEQFNRAVERFLDGLFGSRAVREAAARGRR
jgi:pimeloyl-ACP methyl ester carboxylesterase